MLKTEKDYVVGIATVNRRTDAIPLIIKFRMIIMCIILS